MNIDMWKKASSRRKRILFTIVILAVSLIITGIGALMPIGSEEANQIVEELNRTIESLIENNSLTQFIFGNNFMICLLMFIPVIGPIFGFYVLFNTGTIVGALAIAAGSNPFLVLTTLFLNPIAWLEFASYSIALAESFWIVRRASQGLWKHELKNAAILVSLCAVLLLAGAIFEAVLLSNF